jgi:hypothetical protein
MRLESEGSSNAAANSDGPATDPSGCFNLNSASKPTRLSVSSAIFGW